MTAARSGSHDASVIIRAAGPLRLSGQRRRGLAWPRWLPCLVRAFACARERTAAGSFRGLRAVFTFRLVEIMVFAFWPGRPGHAGQRNRTVKVSPVAGSLTSNSWPVCRYRSKNSYDVIARFAMSVLDRFVRS